MIAKLPRVNAPLADRPKVGMGHRPADVLLGLASDPKTRTESRHPQKPHRGNFRMAVFELHVQCFEIPKPRKTWKRSRGKMQRCLPAFMAGNAHPEGLPQKLSLKDPGRVDMWSLVQRNSWKLNQPSYFPL